MAEYEVTLPNLPEVSGDDEAGETATVSFVYLDEGEEIAEGDDLVEMTTDKAAFNVPCPKSGVIKSMLVSEDDEVKTGQPICILELGD